MTPEEDAGPRKRPSRGRACFAEEAWWFLRLPGEPLPGLGLPWQVSLDLVVLGRLVHILRMGLDFGVLVLLLLVRHFSSFEDFAPPWRCHPTRRILESKSSTAATARL
jgi:hypothetical protein